MQMTLHDLQGHAANADLLKCDFPIAVQLLHDKISNDRLRRNN